MNRKTQHADIINLPDRGIWLESHQHQSDFATTVHSHSYPSLIYVTSGRGKCLTGKNEYELSSNSVIFLRKGQKHQLIDTPKKAMIVFVVYFTERTSKIEKSIVKPLREKICFKIPLQYTKRIRAALRQMLNEQDIKPKFYESAIRQSLTYIFINLNRALIVEQKQSKKLSDNKSSDRVEIVLNYILNHYYEQNHLADVAKAANLSQRQFSNLCKKLTGRSYIQYLNTIRTKKAGQLLRKTNMSVSAIAFEVGFEELSTFYRAFKKYQRINPLKLRK